jgi:hypothetical protein
MEFESSQYYLFLIEDENACTFYMDHGNFTVSPFHIMREVSPFVT